MSRYKPEMEAHIDENSIHVIEIVDRFVSITFNINVNIRSTLESDNQTELYVRIGDYNNFSKSKLVYQSTLIYKENKYSETIHLKSIVEGDSCIWILTLEGGDELVERDVKEITLIDNDVVIGPMGDRNDRICETRNHFLNYSPNVTRMIKIYSHPLQGPSFSGNFVSARLDFCILSRNIGDVIDIEIKTGLELDYRNSQTLKKISIICDKEFISKFIEFETLVKKNMILFVIVSKNGDIECLEYVFMTLVSRIVLNKSGNIKGICWDTKSPDYIIYEDDESRYMRNRNDVMKNEYFR